MQTNVADSRQNNLVFDSSYASDLRALAWLSVTESVRIPRQYRPEWSHLNDSILPQPWVVG